jgi:hypothetical protein
MSLKTTIAGVAWAAAVCCTPAQSWAQPAGDPVKTGAVADRKNDSSVSASEAASPLTVDGAFLAGSGSMLRVNFKVPAPKTTEWLPVDPKETYVVDEATGEKFFVLNLVRIGPAAQTRLPKGGGASFMVIDNRHEHLKPGARITVVIGALKREHVTVAEQ